MNRFLARKVLWAKGADLSLVLSILKAYEQVGGSKAIPVVEKLAAGEGYGRKDSRVREASQLCLPFLQERAAQESAQQTLLRPAQETTAASDALLRPAAGSSEADPQRLLRASTIDRTS